jgi:hypothetical protein
MERSAKRSLLQTFFCAEHMLNLRHVIMAYQISFAVVPRNRNLAPRSCDNRTKVIHGDAIAPANSVVGLEFSGLLASHFCAIKKAAGINLRLPGSKIGYE